MKMHCCRRHPVNLPLGLGNALEDGDGFLLHPGGQLAARDQLLDLRKIALLLVVMVAVIMAVAVGMFVLPVMVGMAVVMTVFVAMTVVVTVLMMVMVVVPVLVAMHVVMVVVVRVFMSVVMIMREVDIKLDAGNGGFFAALHMQVVAIELELGQFAFELVLVHAQVNERADEHVASDAAEEVEIEGFHLDSATRALIWLAA
jgi:hypothetical protein